MKQEKLKGSFTYEPPTSTYTATVKKPYQWWWWLLLLLLFIPLFIRCERTITVKVVDTDGNPVEDVEVKADCTAYYFLAHSESYADKGTTGKDGEVTFSGIECSFYCWLFHHGEDISFSAEPPAPYLPATKDASKHSDDTVTITLDEQGYPVNVQVVDALDNSPLSGAEVVVTRSGSGVGTFHTDAGGIAMIPDIKRRDKLSIAARKSGYETNDTTLASVRGKDLMVTPPRVIPLKKKFECDDNMSFNGKGERSMKVDMHDNGGTFNVSFYTSGYPDRLIVYDDNGRQIFDTGLVLHEYSPALYSNIKFGTRYLTFRVIPDPEHPDNSVWDVHPYCPN